MVGSTRRASFAMDPRTASSAGIRLERLLHVTAHAPLLGLAASASQRTAARLLLVSTRPAHHAQSVPPSHTLCCC